MSVLRCVAGLQVALDLLYISSIAVIMLPNISKIYAEFSLDLLVVFS